MSKFSDLLKQTYFPLGIVLEQEENAETSENIVEAPPTEDTSSELPIVSNDDIRKLATALQVFYSKEDAELNQDVVNEIRSIGPVVDDATAKAVVTTLTKLLAPTAIDTKPEQIQNSDFSV